jgi:hypothetical protein
MIPRPCALPLALCGSPPSGTGPRSDEHALAVRRHIDEVWRRVVAHLTCKVHGVHTLSRLGVDDHHVSARNEREDRVRELLVEET